LAGGRDFVMLSFDLQAAVDHRLHHFIAQIHQLIGRRARKIALFVA